MGVGCGHVLLAVHEDICHIGSPHKCKSRHCTRQQPGRYNRARRCSFTWRALYMGKINRLGDCADEHLLHNLEGERLMPHIHTQPGQHDLTVSAYIIRKVDDEWRCLVHMHRKAGKLMQVGGHVELNETPWQTLIHEIREESGYQSSELDVLQILPLPTIETAVMHPVPFLSNTHTVGNAHFHSDWCYGFVAAALPQRAVAEGESTDMRWCSLAELRALAESGECLRDIVTIYSFLLDNISTFRRIPCNEFSLAKPLRGETFIP